MYRSLVCVYMGSFKNNKFARWNHMLLVQHVIAGELATIEEFITITTNTSDIVFKDMMHKPLEGQMLLC